MRVAIVEDEAVVARRLARMVHEIAHDASIEHASSLPAALELLRARPIDVLFLDLNLNGRDGFELLEQAAAAPFQTVVVSAHHDQALRAFEYGVTDFVAKPWSEERLRTAIERTRGREPGTRGRARRLIVRKGRETRAIEIERIVFVQGADDYSELHLDDGSVHLHEKTLTALEALLPTEFARVHRSFIANLARARAVRASAGRPLLVFDDESAIPIGRVYRALVREKLVW